MTAEGQSVCRQAVITHIEVQATQNTLTSFFGTLRQVDRLGLEIDRDLDMADRALWLQTVRMWGKRIIIQLTRWPRSC